MDMKKAPNSEGDSKQKKKCQNCYNTQFQIILKSDEQKLHGSDTRQIHRPMEQK